MQFCLKQVEILNTKPESSEYAEAPATPMLVEEANLSNVQEGLVSDDHLESEARNIHDEMEVKQAETNGCSEPAAECVDCVMEYGSLPSSSCPEPEQPMLSASECPNGIMENNQTETQKAEARPVENVTTSCSIVSLKLDKHGPSVVDGAAEKINSPKQSSEDIDSQLGSFHSPGIVDGVQVYELKDHESSSILQKDMQSKVMQGLQTCNSNFTHQDNPLVEGDMQCPQVDVTEIIVDETQTLEPASNRKVQANAGELLDQFYNEALKDQSGNDNSDPPAPEKLLSASDSGADKLNNPLLESTPSNEGLVEGRKQLSGRKRTLTESAASLQISSSESFGFSLSKQTVESIPNDDDLLSSILGIFSRSLLDS